ncbi:MAG: ABC transporter ATP-binding protein [Clostridia bacterium]|nr:ABC transporter ATP-binding protein [Clostridia bacterium]
MKAIEAKGLTKFYGSARGIIDVDLSVENGDFFGFIGPNGAGKSTFIRTLMGFISPTRGQASVLGLDIVKNSTEILSKVGYLPSEAAFYSGMRVKDALALSASLRGMKLNKEAMALCERFALDPSRKIHELSLGNRKKTAIVAALQHNPEIYILDEPTSGLDPIMQKVFYEILKERNIAGATVFLSSHILSEVEKYCKNAAVIREGKIITSASVDKLSHTGVKRVRILGFGGDIQISGIRDVKKDADTTSFLFSGDVGVLVHELSKHTFRDVTIEDSDLEEVFMHYYKKEDE